MLETICYRFTIFLKLLKMKNETIDFKIQLNNDYRLNCSMSGINSGHHNLPTYQMSLKSDNIEFVRYCGGHFGNDDQ
jgi:hypothetical protein